MEQVPQGNEQNEQPQPERPVLCIDLSSTQRNPLSLMLRTRELLGDDEWEAFGQEIQEAGTAGTNKDYHDLLTNVNTHVELIDISETHPIYGNPERVQDVTERYQRRVIAAIDHLNEQIMILPTAVPCGIDGLYPDFDEPDHSPEAYIVVLNTEIGSVEGHIEHASGEQREALERYRFMLRECRAALRRIGVL